MKVIDVEALPANPLAALRELSRADVELEALRRERVDAARRQGATWDQIGQSLGMSRQSAWEYYTRETRHVLDESVAGCDLDEEEAMRVALPSPIPTLRDRCWPLFIPGRFRFIPGRFRFTGTGPKEARATRGKRRSPVSSTTATGCGCKPVARCPSPPRSPRRR